MHTAYRQYSYKPHDLISNSQSISAYACPVATSNLSAFSQKWLKAKNSAHLPSQYTQCNNIATGSKTYNNIRHNLQLKFTIMNHCQINSKNVPSQASFYNISQRIQHLYSYFVLVVLFFLFVFCCCCCFFGKRPFSPALEHSYLQGAPIIVLVCFLFVCFSI